MKEFSLILMTSLALSFAGCTQEQAEQTEEVVTDAEQSAHESVKADGADSYSPYTRGYPQRVLFGDTHVHTALSNDAFGAGNTLGPEIAYQFARGDKIVTSHGESVKLNQPLDFVVVADHAEAYTAFQQIAAGNPAMMEDERVREWNGWMKEGTPESNRKLAEAFANAMLDRSLPEVLFDPAMIKSMWDKYLETTEKYNDPGNFTALHGYEWTSTPKGANLHRVVIFKDGIDKPSQIVPFSAADSEDPEDLYDFFASYEEKTGGKVLSIAHNGNWSSGTMFDTKTLTGGEINRAYAEQRMRWEPIYEVTQMKGDGEAHPMLSPDDEFADYETWDTSLSGVPLTVERLLGEYGRSGLKRGLEFEAQLGTNPYKFGMVGSTDTHTSLATADEDNFFGISPSDLAAGEGLGIEHRAAGPVTVVGKR
jgi:hypothetical protein